MRRGHVDGPQCFRIEPVVSMAKAEHADRADLAVDEGELKLTIGGCRFDASPL